MMTLVPRPLLTSAQLSTTSLPHIDSFHSLLTAMISTHFDPETQQYHPAATSPRGFKSLPSSIPTPTCQPILTPAKWQKFWFFRIPLNARNSWFLILHDKIATRDHLRRRQPTIHQPICGLCHSSRETTEHFLFACPLKRSFFSTALKAYMPSSINPNTYSSFRKLLLLEHHLSRQHHPIYPELSVYQVFACMLQTTWYYHYQYVFHGTPFLPPLLLSSLCNSLDTLHSQENFDQLP